MQQTGKFTVEPVVNILVATLLEIMHKPCIEVGSQLKLDSSGYGRHTNCWGIPRSFRATASCP